MYACVDVYVCVGVDADADSFAYAYGHLEVDSEARLDVDAVVNSYDNVCASVHVLSALASTYPPLRRHDNVVSPSFTHSLSLSATLCVELPVSAIRLTHAFSGAATAGMLKPTSLPVLSSGTGRPALVQPGTGDSRGRNLVPFSWIGSRTWLCATLHAALQCSELCSATPHLSSPGPGCRL